MDSVHFVSDPAMLFTIFGINGSQFLYIMEQQQHGFSDSTPRAGSDR